MPNVQPTLKPIKSSEKRSTNKFFNLLKIGKSHKIINNIYFNWTVC